MPKTRRYLLTVQLDLKISVFWQDRAKANYQFIYSVCDTGGYLSNVYAVPLKNVSPPICLSPSCKKGMIFLCFNKAFQDLNSENLYFIIIYIVSVECKVGKVITVAYE